MTSSSVVDTSTPITITYSGGEGSVITLTAAGAEIDDYSNAAPTIATWSNGHAESFTLRGAMQYKFHAMAGQWLESQASGQVTATNHSVDGVQQPDTTTSVPAGSGTYSCSGSKLTLVEKATDMQATYTFTKSR